MKKGGYLPLQQAIPGSQSVQRIITLTSRSHESTERICSLLARDDMAILVDMSDVDLHRGVVLGGDETVCRRTNHSKQKWDSSRGGRRTICGGRRDQLLFLGRFP